MYETEVLHTTKRSAERKLRTYKRVNRECGLSDNLRVQKIIRYKIVGHIIYPEREVITMQAGAGKPLTI